MLYNCLKNQRLSRREERGNSLPPVFVKFFISFLFIFIVAISISAQESEYIIGVTDVLQVSVWEQEQLSRQVIVRPDGKITLPLLGDIQAAGLTPTALSNDIAKKLSSYLKDAPVTVSVMQFNSQSIDILGQVSKQGKYSFAIIPSLVELLTKAGGSLPTADLTAVRIIPKNTSRPVMTVDLDAFFEKGDVSMLPKLQSGDTVYIPKKPEAPNEESTPAETGTVPESIPQKKLSSPMKIDIFGQVPKPGRYEFDYQPTIVEALTKAGGVADSFLLQKVRLVRGNATSSGMIVVDVAKFLENGDYSLLPELRSGDIIYVPEVDPMDKMKQRGFSVTGRVVSPGNYFISKQIGLLEALGMAGGLQPDADTEKIKITRETSDSFESQIVDISDLLKKEIPEAPTVIIHPGDTIFVPMKSSTISSTANAVRGIAIFLRDVILLYSAYRVITQ